MRSFSKLGFALCATATLAFTGCQQYTQPQNPVNTQPENNQFNLQGKIGVKLPSSQGVHF